MSNIRRYIAVFSKSEDKLLYKFDLPEIELELLQDLVGERKSNPMYDCYDIDNSCVSFFKNYIDIDFDFEKYEYSLEASSVKA